MASRLQLQTLLETILGNRRVYFDPPATVKLSYPCIVYTFAGDRTKKANNKNYLDRQGYDITYITLNPDDTKPSTIKALPYCSFDRHYCSDNLHHFVYTIYY